MTAPSLAGLSLVEQHRRSTQRSRSRSPTAPSTSCASRRKGRHELHDKIKEVIDELRRRAVHEGHARSSRCAATPTGRSKALRRAGAPVTAVDILPDPQIREDLSEISGWPTIPQVFVKGELIGGADIVEELEATGELETTLREKLGDELRRGRAPSRSSR